MTDTTPRDQLAELVAKSPVNDVRQELTDIARWAPLMPATWSDMPVRASRIGDGVHVRMSHAPLPGGMERAVDTWDLSGPLGIHTQIGVRQALGPWVDELRGMGGPRFPIGPVVYLVTNLDWARTHMDPQQWAYMAADVHGVHDRVQSLVCPDREVIGECPDTLCHGIVRANTGRHGVAPTGTCDTCKREFHTDPDQYARDVRAIGQGLTVTPLATVTTAQIQRIWAGEISADLVKKWVKLGKVKPLDTTPMSFPLAKINVLAHDTIEKRRRRAEKRAMRMAG